MRTTHGMTSSSNGAPTPSNRSSEELRTSVRAALAKAHRTEAAAVPDRQAPRTGAAPHSGAPLAHRNGYGAGRGRSVTARGQQPNRCQALRRRGG